MADVKNHSNAAVSATHLHSTLVQLSEVTATYGAHTVAFQPRTKYPIEDRHIVEDWELPNGTWKFIGVFDGHGAGHEAVDFVLETLPAMIRESLAREVNISKITSSATIEEVLIGCISRIDDIIKADLADLFPGGQAQLSTLSDDEIKAFITDPKTGHSYVQAMRARTGTTALIALVDPSRSLHVASLGDCEALLGTKKNAGNWKVDVLSKRHNAHNEIDAERVRSEHPGEAECIVDGRVLGLITVTRAIWDIPFKLPAIYTERVFALATPPFHENINLKSLLSRNLTPPYLSNVAEVEHVELSPLHDDSSPILILCSDGLPDLYSRRSKEEDLSQSIGSWLSRVSFQNEENLALSLLWDALGGNADLETTEKIIVGTPGRRVDDTTVVVVRL